VGIEDGKPVFIVGPQSTEDHERGHTDGLPIDAEVLKRWGLKPKRGFRHGGLVHARGFHKCLQPHTVKTTARTDADCEKIFKDCLSGYLTDPRRFLDITEEGSWHEPSATGAPYIYRGAKK
jgi:hypothetical protein